MNDVAMRIKEHMKRQNVIQIAQWQQTITNWKVSANGFVERAE